MKIGYKQAPEHVAKRIAKRLETLASKHRGPGADWLQQRYVTDGLDCAQIGALVGRDPKTVWAWLRHYAIPTRPRGSHDKLPKDGRGFRGRNHTADYRARLSELSIAQGRVPFDPAVGPPMRGKRGSETSNWKGGATPERQAFYASSEWREACRAVWHRADARCERCCEDSRDRNQPFHVHHIVSFANRALRATVSNLALLCRPCHHFVHSAKNTNRDFIGS